MNPIDRAERSIATGPERGRRMTSARVEHLPPAWPLLEAKLESPGERAGAVDRERVVSTLLAPPGSTIVSLVAPPGYGKTTVLAQWAAREPRPVAWLTLDELDNDPVILVRYLVAALGRIGPVDPSIATGHAASRDRILGAAMPRLVSEVYRWREPALLILDDAHRLEDRTCLDALTALLDHLPPNLSVALAGRTEPAVPFGRYRAGWATPRDRPGVRLRSISKRQRRSPGRPGASSTPMASSSCIGEPRAGRSGPTWPRSPAGGPGVSAACRSPSPAVTATSRPTWRPS